MLYQGQVGYVVTVIQCAPALIQITPHIDTAYKGRRMVFLLGESDLDTCQGTGRGNIPKLFVPAA